MVRCRTLEVVSQRGIFDGIGQKYARDEIGGKGKQDFDGWLMDDACDCASGETERFASPFADTREMEKKDQQNEHGDSAPLWVERRAEKANRKRSPGNEVMGPTKKSARTFLVSLTLASLSRARATLVPSTWSSSLARGPIVRPRVTVSSPASSIIPSFAEFPLFEKSSLDQLLVTLTPFSHGVFPSRGIFILYRVCVCFAEFTGVITINLVHRYSNNMTSR